MSDRPIKIACGGFIVASQEFCLVPSRPVTASRTRWLVISLCGAYVKIDNYIGVNNENISTDRRLDCDVTFNCTSSCWQLWRWEPYPHDRRHKEGKRCGYLSHRAFRKVKKDPPRWVFFVGTVLLATNIDIALLDGACDGVHFSIKI